MVRHNLMHHIKVEEILGIINNHGTIQGTTISTILVITRCMIERMVLLSDRTHVLFLEVKKIIIVIHHLNQQMGHKMEDRIVVEVVP